MLYTSYADLKRAGWVDTIDRFVEAHPDGNYFQSTEFFRLIESVKGYRPVLLIAINGRGDLEGVLLGVLQSDGSGPKAWLSRRLIVWGGPIVVDHAVSVARALLEALTRYARHRAIFIEFRNFFDCTPLHEAFASCGFRFKPHLNYLVKTDSIEAAKARLSSNRRRQIKTSLAAGAVAMEAQSEGDVLTMYSILEKLYREKVKKPLPHVDLFLQLWRSPSAKVFVVKYNGEVIGGSIGPIYRNKVLYQWYVCGENGRISGVHPSVLASWAPIEYGATHGFDHFDFMGAGRPDEDYGVREFKARFGGQEVCYGRYERVLNRPLFEVGKLGLKIYQYIR